MTTKNLIFDVYYAIIGSEIRTSVTTETSPNGVFFTSIPGGREYPISADHRYGRSNLPVPILPIGNLLERGNEMEKQNLPQVAAEQGLSKIGYTPTVEIHNKIPTTSNPNSLDKCESNRYDDSTKNTSGYRTRRGEFSTFTADENRKYTNIGQPLVGLVESATCSNSGGNTKTQGLTMTENIGVLKIEPTPIVEINNKIPTTTSVKIAEFFGKEHKNVLRDIKKLKENPYDPTKGRCVLTPRAEFINKNIRRSYYYDRQGKRQFQWRLTRDGFILLAMGFTGPKALDFKIAYINAFNEMERKLNQPTLPVPAPAQNTQITTTETPRPRRDVYIGGVTVYDRMELIAAAAKFLDVADDPVARGRRLSAAYDCLVMAQNLGPGAIKEVR